MKKSLLITTVILTMVISSTGFSEAITNNAHPSNGETKVTVIVQSITVTSGSNGSFTANETKYTGKKIFHVSRADPFVVAFKANKNYLIDTVTSNESHITVNGGKVTIPAGSGDVAVFADFKYAGEKNPGIISLTGDDCPMVLWIILLTIAAVGAGIAGITAAGKRRKRE